MKVVGSIGYAPNVHNKKRNQVNAHIIAVFVDIFTYCSYSVMELPCPNTQYFHTLLMCVIGRSGGDLL